MPAAGIGGAASQPIEARPQPERRRRRSS
jgi:hypothetical protein